MDFRLGHLTHTLSHPAASGTTQLLVAPSTTPCPAPARVRAVRQRVERRQAGGVEGVQGEGPHVGRPQVCEIFACRKLKGPEGSVREVTHTRPHTRRRRSAIKSQTTAGLPAGGAGSQGASTRTVQLQRARSVDQARGGAARALAHHPRGGAEQPGPRPLCRRVCGVGETPGVAGGSHRCSRQLARQRARAGRRAKRWPPSQPWPQARARTRRGEVVERRVDQAGVRRKHVHTRPLRCGASQLGTAQYSAVPAGASANTLCAALPLLLATSESLAQPLRSRFPRGPQPAPTSVPAPAPAHSSPCLSTAAPQQPPACAP